MPVDSPSALDTNWAIFFASGDPAAVRRVVSALELRKDFGALERFKQSQKTDADKQGAYRDATFRAALWSISANCRLDENIHVICQKLSSSGKLPALEQKVLDMILSSLKSNPSESDLFKRLDEI